MRNRSFFLVLCLFLVLPLAAQQSAKDIQAELEAKYKGQIVKTKVSFPGSWMHFDDTGTPKRRPDPCESWTLCNLLEVEKISLSDHSVKLDGQRIGVAFEDGKQKLFRLQNQLVGIEIDIDGMPDLRKANSALCKIFVCGKDNFADYLPYAWARYFDPKTKVPSPPVSSSDKDAQKIEAAVKTLRVSAGVQASKLISYPKPRYPDTAKSYLRQGTVSMAATIGRDGRIHGLFLVKPAGFGLDEAAIEAVRQWVYQPTMLMGEPVEVETTINVNFTLERR